jgi:hypothetical protein
MIAGLVDCYVAWRENETSLQIEVNGGGQECPPYTIPVLRESSAPERSIEDLASEYGLKRRQIEQAIR